jgi:hypothetical protein
MLWLPAGGTMKKAHIYSVPSKTPQGYAWKWRAATGKRVSAKSYAFYFDCLDDARDGGYEVALTYAMGATAPGGAVHSLR